MPRVLIVAYGNPLRSDDGIAWRVADALEGKFPDVEILRLHQLAPEVAYSVSRFETVVFVDAANEPGTPGDIRVEAVSAEDATSSSSHALSPATVMALARQLYSASPQSFCVIMTGENFDHGESLSPTVAAALPNLLATVERLIGGRPRKEEPTNDTK